MRLLYFLCINTGILHAPLFLALSNNANFIFSVLSPHFIRFPLLYPVLKFCFAMLEMLMGLAAWGEHGHSNYINYYIEGLNAIVVLCHV